MTQDVMEFLQLDLADVCALWEQTTARQNEAAVQRLWLAYRGGEHLDADGLGKGSGGPGRTAKLAVHFPDLSEEARWHLSSRWQRIYNFGKPALEQYIETTEEPTISGVLQEIARLDEEAKENAERKAKANGEWTAEERGLQQELEAGRTVVVNLGRHERLIAWAEEQDLYVRIDRQSEWGNPFKLDRDGDRETVIANYRDHFLPHTGLVDQLDELKGKALGCWCAPEPCHGDVLAIEADGDS